MKKAGEGMSDQDIRSNSSRDNGIDSNKNNDNKSFTRELFSTFIYIIVLASIFFIIQQFFFVPVTVEGDSMEPTLEDEDRLVLNKVRDIERFDVVVFPAPNRPDQQYIKRVIGTPGDRIEFRNDDLYINGEYVEETYLEGLETDTSNNSYVTGDFTLNELTGVETVPEDTYFVLGDNRLNSRDSRSFGFIPSDLVTGETKLQFWPLEDFGFVE